jgi:serine/threonine protein kinase
MRAEISTSIVGGRLFLENRECRIPNIRIDDVIGAGANGMVFSGQHVYIDRRIAVKIWVRMKAHDARDKVTQGLEEINKASRAESRYAIRVYDAGILPGADIVYAVLEFVDGVTCTQWLTRQHPNLFSRLRLAEALTSELFSLAFNGMIHGDPHGGNIMVLPPFAASHNGIISPEFKLVDFGTSYFTSAGFSAQRHWHVFQSTIVRLLHPFNIVSMWKPPPPVSNLLGLYGWYDTFFELIPEIIRLAFGIDIDADPDDAKRWRRGPVLGAPREFCGIQAVHQSLVSLLASGTLALTPEAIGVRHRD